MRLRSVLPAAFVLAAAAPALAQEGLTPTDVHDFGEFSASLRFQLVNGQGDLAGGGIDSDFDLAAYQILFQAAAGLGLGFEAEIALPYQIQGVSKTDGDLLGVDLETEQENLGFGDLELTLVYRLLEEDAAGPQLVLGALVVAPTGNDADGKPDFDLGALSLDGEEGGIGQGVWRYGLGAAVSKRFGPVEPYLAAFYLFGGERSHDGVDEERADVGQVTIGAEFHVTPQATIDVRATLQVVGEDVQEDAGAEQEAEAHVDHSYAAQLYVNLGPGLTLVAGGAVTFVGDHEIDASTGFELEDSFHYSLQIGLHLNVGK